MEAAEQYTVLKVTHVNATEGHIFSEYTEPLDEAFSAAELYRLGSREYGRCTGKVYIDQRVDDPSQGSGHTAHIGYVFVSRERYEDTGEPYLRETWISQELVTKPVYSFEAVELETS